jgi:hypothetical protein
MPNLSGLCVGMTARACAHDVDAVRARERLSPGPRPTAPTSTARDRARRRCATAFGDAAVVPERGDDRGDWSTGSAALASRSGRAPGAERRLAQALSAFLQFGSQSLRVGPSARWRHVSLDLLGAGAKTAGKKGAGVLEPRGQAGSGGGGGGGGGGDGDAPTPPADASLAAEAQRRYLNYAVSVITSRALPDVRDG